MLAVHGIRLVALQAAVLALMTDLGRAEQHMRQAQEQRHPEDHDEHGQQPATGALQGDVAEAGGGQRGDREVQGVDVVVDLRSEEHTSELQSLMRISYAVFCLKNKQNKKKLQHA